MCGQWIRNPLIFKSVSFTTGQKDNLLEFKKTGDLRLGSPPKLSHHTLSHTLFVPHILFNSGKQTGCCLMLMVKQLCLYHLHIIHFYKNEENNIREHNSGASRFDSVCQKFVHVLKKVWNPRPTDQAQFLSEI